MPPAKTVVYASLGPELVQYDLNVRDATLERKSAIMLPAQIQAAWPHTTQPFLYVASSNGGPMAALFLDRPPAEEHFLTALRMAPSGALTQIGDCVPLKSRPIHMCLDRAGAHILVAYNDPPDLTIHAIAGDGAIGPERPHPPLGLRKYPHQVMVSPQDDLVVICARGNIPMATTAEDPGALHPFAYDNGTIREVLPFTAPNDGYGYGARHLDFHPSRPFAYLLLEAQNELHVYRYDRRGFGAAPVFATTTLFGEPSSAHQFCGTIHLHPNARFLYAANRTIGTKDVNGEKHLDNGANEIAVFNIESADGRPVPVQRISTQGVMPRTFGFDQAGELLIVANHMPVTGRDGASGTMRTVPQSLVLFRIGADGRLTFVRKYDIEAGNNFMFWMDVVRVAG